jgi:Na+/H+-translocating membrane pyrophosphatase
MFQIVLSLVAAIAAIAVGVALYRRVIAAPTSTDRANEIAAAIRSGARRSSPASIGPSRRSGVPFF